VRNYGTVVPQGIWSLDTATDAQRYNNAALNMPIFFVHNDRRTLGLHLVSAAAGHCVGLMDGRAVAQVGACHTTSIRIKVSESQLMRFVQSDGYGSCPVAWIQRVGHSDHDSGPNFGAQNDTAREIGQTCRARGVQVPGGKLSDFPSRVT